MVGIDLAKHGSVCSKKKVRRSNRLYSRCVAKSCNNVSAKIKKKLKKYFIMTSTLPEQPEKITPVTECAEQPEKITPEQPVKLNQKRWICKLCHNPFSSKRSLAEHVERGICLGKGFLCMRCFKFWKTPSALKKHQFALNKCPIKRKCTFERNNDGTITQTIE